MIKSRKKRGFGLLSNLVECRHKFLIFLNLLGPFEKKSLGKPGLHSYVLKHKKLTIFFNICTICNIYSYVINYCINFKFNVNFFKCIKKLIEVFFLTNYIKSTILKDKNFKENILSFKLPTKFVHNKLLTYLITV